jgi:glycosyltransferase involved in cell wall biosynthesis
LNFLIVGHVVHTYAQGKFFAYGPYVREMNLWLDQVDQVLLVAPFSKESLPDPIDLPYLHPNIQLREVPEFSVTSAGELARTMLKLPKILVTTWKAMREADHIHLRCPGNMGLIGSVVQIFFPGKLKSAKYAGNWDRSAPKPFTYRIQQGLLSNTFLSRKMQVLVYGNWSNETSNIRPFFTASYSESELAPLEIREIDFKKPIQLIFAGGLVEGKQPMLSAQVASGLIDAGIQVQLDIYGEGPERSKLEDFIREKNLGQQIRLYGNVPAETLKEGFRRAHFLIFISESEGWPKVVAEAMFWACLPITTRVSCVPQMLGEGERGILVKPDVIHIQEVIREILSNPDTYREKCRKAADWSRQFTLEKFKKELRSVIFQHGSVQ